MKYLYISIVWVLLFTFHCIQFKEHPLDPTTLQGQLLHNILKYFIKANNSYVPTFILMYPSSGTYDGNIKGSASTTREAVDTICSNTFSSLILDFPEYSYLNNKKGFISIDTTDQIFDMPIKFGVPTNVPILGPDTNNSNRLVANNWDDLWDIDDTYYNVIKNTLVSAIGLSSPNQWWSGSDQSGNMAVDLYSGSPLTCSGWTSTSGPTGYYGYPMYMNNYWITVGSAVCSNSFFIICIAW